MREARVTQQLNKNTQNKNIIINICINKLIANKIKYYLINIYTLHRQYLTHRPLVCAWIAFQYYFNFFYLNTKRVHNINKLIFKKKKKKKK